MDTQHIKTLENWLNGGEFGKPSVVQLSVHASTNDANQIIGTLKNQLDLHLADRREKGIYVWFWLEEGIAEPWPLYVGKAQRGRSCFRARMNVHLGHSLRGVDSLYSQKTRSDAGGLHRNHKAGEEISSNHSHYLSEQFSSMRILFLPMSDHDAAELAGKAESLMLSAALRIHGAALCANGKAWDRLMNSTGKTLSIRGSEHLIDNAVLALKSWLLTAPTTTPPSRR